MIVEAIIEVQCMYIMCVFSCVYVRLGSNALIWQLLSLCNVSACPFKSSGILNHGKKPGW